jgi:D-glycero-D-manno-heptose 1,7-bisphosphate phosphatase
VSNDAGRRSAVFLDRDGTIIEDVAYLRDPDDARLIPGAARAIKQLNDRGILAIVVTNQSGMARGLVSRHQYRPPNGGSISCCRPRARSSTHITSALTCPS